MRPLAGVPEIEPGTSLGRIVTDAAAPVPDDVVVLSHKVVSKAEGRARDLAQIVPGERARDLARSLDKDPRLVELILSESSSIVRAERGVLIVETRQGFICANAGIDSSNTGPGGPERVILLPEDPDASARRIRAEIRETAGATPGVVIADSFGRPWRVGQADVAIGCAGIAPLEDWRGRADADARELSATVVAVADEIAAAADLVRSKDAGVPGAVISGLGRHVSDDDGPGAAALRREQAADLFR